MLVLGVGIGATIDKQLDARLVLASNRIIQRSLSCLVPRIDVG